MCTVSWLHHASGYRLFCNRDELRSRGIARPPRQEWAEAVRYLAPRDPDRGGTWIAVNESGLTLCLLNGAGQGLTQRSRGLLVPELMPCASATAVGSALAPARLRPYAPFTLVALDSTGATLVGEWDGVGVSVRTVPEGMGLLSSSSVDAAGAQRVRSAEFARLRAVGTVNEESLVRLHESHADGVSACSPCMHRAEAETVSFTRILVEPGSIRMVYAPDAPCRRPPASTSELTPVLRHA